MKNNQAQPHSVIEAFGKAIGCVVGTYTTMPLFEYSYAWFSLYALTYSPREYHWLWELLYISFLFIAVVLSTWFLLNFVIVFFKAVFRFVFVSIALLLR